ncbi:hypothetical protein SNEBB_009819 [Seison nebaliae]|nr:hypothetical protein SNEBB_009819 [Seison nebaliae]
MHKLIFILLIVSCYTTNSAYSPNSRFVWMAHRDKEVTELPLTIPEEKRSDRQQFFQLLNEYMDYAGIYDYYT